ncbi:MAG: OsmC family protein [Bacteroidales bacterium]|nr:OsmC family protein [Bacteroidales bacterium]
MIRYGSHENLIFAEIIEKMIQKIDCTWKNEMAFEADVNGFKIMLDAEDAVGGMNRGPRPKPLTLVSLAGCTGMDVISILRKMRIEPSYFNVAVEGELTEEHPKYYHKIHVIYEIKGENIDPEKVEKAINLSRDRYCGVFALLHFGSEITYELRLIE